MADDVAIYTDTSIEIATPARGGLAMTLSAITEQNHESTACVKHKNSV